MECAVTTMVALLTHPLDNYNSQEKKTFEWRLLQLTTCRIIGHAHKRVYYTDNNKYTEKRKTV